MARDAAIFVLSVVVGFGFLFKREGGFRSTPSCTLAAGPDSASRIRQVFSTPRKSPSSLDGLLEELRKVESDLAQAQSAIGGSDGVASANRQFQSRIEIQYRKGREEFLGQLQEPFFQCRGGGRR